MPLHPSICPEFTGRNARSGGGKQWNDSYFSTDTVLDVDSVARRAAHLGNEVRVRRIEGGLHDLLLSRELACGPSTIIY